MFTESPPYSREFPPYSINFQGLPFLINTVGLISLGPINVKCVWGPINVIYAWGSIKVKYYFRYLTVCLVRKFSVLVSVSLKHNEFVLV